MKNAIHQIIKKVADTQHGDYAIYNTEKPAQDCPRMIRNNNNNFHSFELTHGTCHLIP